LQRKISEKHHCYFQEEMDNGFSVFYSSTDTEKYLGFNQKGKPFNYTATSLATTAKIDKQCRKIFKKKLTASSSSDQSPATSVDYEQTTQRRPATSTHHRRHKSSSARTRQRSNINKIEPTKVRSTASHSSARRHKVHTKTSPAPTHAHRHHHNIHHRYNHTTSNKVIDSYDNTISAERLGNEDLNALYSHNDSSVNIDKPRQTTTMATTLVRHQHRKKTTPSVAGGELDFPLPGLNVNVKDNELSQSNCTNDTGNCLGEPHLRGRKGGKARKKLDEELTTRRQKKTSETTARKSSRKSHKIERENT
jgi:hypothetical protein